LKEKMSKVSKEISCITGEYTNAAGERKKRYQLIGSIIETKNGPMLKIDVIPLREGGWDGWAYINDPRPKEERQERKSASFEDDDLPF
jgi:hypothetical protein